ncbi:MAG TPA: hypothetical protein VGR19_00250 [Allosphingosinicella sp.]|nr:hypothetical protein [Allosphingosinicella sp.]
MLLRTACFLSLALAAVPATAAEQLKKIPAALDPAKAYVLVEVHNHDEGIARGVVVFARYDPEGGDLRGGKRSPPSGLGKDVPVRIASTKPLLKEKERRLYLLTLEPDTWVIEGAGGTAFSLGSKTFKAVAGQVIDLGIFSPGGDWPDGEGPFKLTAGKLVGMALLGPFAKGPKPQPAMLAIRERTADDMPVPEPLRARVVSAVFTSGAKFGNYLGGLVNRIDGRKGRPGSQPVEAAAPAAGAGESR